MGIYKVKLGDVHCYGSEFLMKESSVLCISLVLLELSLCAALCHVMTQEDGPQQMWAF